MVELPFTLADTKAKSADLHVQDTVHIHKTELATLQDFKGTVLHVQDTLHTGAVLEVQDTLHIKDTYLTELLTRPKRCLTHHTLRTHT